MKWFKHMTDMIDDPKIKRVVRKYGVEGYGVYNFIIERIAKRLETISPVPDLEESATDIADALRMDTVKVEGIVKYCIEQGLFEHDEVTGRILCHKIYKFLDKAQTRSSEVRRMIEQYRMSQTVRDISGRSETNLIEQNRTEQNRTEQIGESHFVYRSEYPEEFESFCTVYPKDADKAKAFPPWDHLIKSLIRPADIIHAASAYAYECEQKNTELQYISEAHNFLKEKWKSYLGKPEKPAELDRHCPVCGKLVPIGFICTNCDSDLTVKDGRFVVEERV